LITIKNTKLAKEKIFAPKGVTKVYRCPSQKSGLMGSFPIENHLILARTQDDVKKIESSTLFNKKFYEVEFELIQDEKK
jgi:hypothetical protein